MILSCLVTAFILRVKIGIRCLFLESWVKISGILASAFHRVHASDLFHRGGTLSCTSVKLTSVAYARFLLVLVYLCSFVYFFDLFFYFFFFLDIINPLLVLHFEPNQKT